MRDDAVLPLQPGETTPETWPRVKRILADALELDGADRDRFLATTCASDPQLRSQVDALLRAHDQSGPIDRLAAELVSPLLEGARSTLAAEVEPPTEAGHYTLIDPIGAGGMGVVYSARDTRLGRNVALKFLRPHLVADDVATARFLQEARSAAALDHPNICTIFEVGQSSDGKLFIAMPLYEGETLQSRIARGQLPVAEAADIALQAARGLAATHEGGIVHRDLKPSNFFLTRDGLVKILDFGIAKLAGTAHPISGERVGTVAYMSPEQAEGREVDLRTDIWSLGAVLYEMLAGRRAFSGENEAEVINAILHENVAPLRALRPDVPADLAVALTAMLSRDCAARPASMRELFAVLAHYADGRSAGAARSARRRMTVAAGLLVAITALGFGTLRFRAGGPTPAADPNVVAVFPFSVAGKDVEFLGEGMVSLLSKQLDGAGALRTVDSRAVLATTRAAHSARIDPRTAREIAARLGAATFVLGDVTEAGQRVRLQATLYENGSPRGKGEAEGSGSDLFRLVDEVAAELLIAARGASGGRPLRIAALTTTSLPALKAYLSGDASYRAERYTDAVEWYERAVSLDTAFALGHFHLALAAQQLTLGSVAAPSLVRALRHAHRLPARDRRMVEALHTHYFVGHSEAADRLRTLLGVYPDEVEAWHALGIILLLTNPLHGRSISEAREPFERAARYDPGSPFPVRHLVYVAAAEGRFRAVDSLITRLDSLGGRGDRWFEMEGLRVAARRDPVGRRAFLSALDTAQDVQVLMATDARVIFGGDFDGAVAGARLLTRPTRSSEARSVAHAWLAHLYASRGRWLEAQQEIAALRGIDQDAALDTQAELMTLPYAPVTAPQRDSLRHLLELASTATVLSGASTADAHWYYVPRRRARPAIRIYLGGMLALLAGDTAAARSTSARMSARAGKVEPAGAVLLNNLAHTLRAAILAGERKDKQALRELESIKDPNIALAVGAPLGSYPTARLLRAEVLERLGRFEDALPWCTTIGYVSLYEITYVPSAHQCAGRILTRLGKTDEARSHHAELLRLWQRADTELAGFVRRL